MKSLLDYCSPETISSKLNEVADFIFDLPNTPEGDLVAAVYFQALSDFHDGMAKSLKYHKIYNQTDDPLIKSKAMDKIIRAELSYSAALNFLMKDDYGVFVEPSLVVNYVKSHPNSFLDSFTDPA